VLWEPWCVERRAQSRQEGQFGGKSPVIKSLSRALRLLRSLERRREGCRLVELSREHGLHKTTCLRLLRTLVAGGLAARDPTTGRYFLGHALPTRVGPFLGPAAAFLGDVQSLLDELANTRDATSLIIFPDAPRRNARVALYSAAPGPLRLEPSSTALAPLHATAGGKCYLAFAPEAEVNGYLEDGLEGATGQTITSPRALMRELAAVRERGYALNRGEAITRSPGVGVPLHNADGVVAAGMSLGLAERDFDEEELLAHLPALNDTEATLRELLSYGSFARYMREFGLEAPVPMPEPAAAPSGDEDGDRPLVRSVLRAMPLLAILWRSQEGMPVSKLARRQGLDDSTTRRLLHTLAAEGFLRREGANKHYHVDPVLWLRLAPLIRELSSVGRTVAFVLERLAHHSGATAGLLCPDSGGRSALVCAYELPPNPVHFRAQPQDSPPLHATAAGKCYLAVQPPSRIASYVRGGLEVLTEHTISTAEKLREELAVVRKQGYGVSREESTPGVCGLAVSIVDGAGDVVGAVSIAPVASDFSQRNIEKWLPQLRVAAETLSRVLKPGWQRRLRRKV